MPVDQIEMLHNWPLKVPYDTLFFTLYSSGAALHN